MGYEPVSSSDEEEEPDVVPRAEWGARPPLRVRPYRDLPTTAVYSETETKGCSTRAECVKVVQEIQNYHMDVRGLPDIQYNFLIGGDGNVYEGRGWDHEGGIDLKNKNYPVKQVEGTVIEVAFIGTFIDDAPPKSMLQLASGLILAGINQSKLLITKRADNALSRGELERMKKKGKMHVQAEVEGKVSQDLQPFVDEEEEEFNKSLKSS